jgi:hypothetical protein
MRTRILYPAFIFTVFYLFINQPSFSQEKSPVMTLENLLKIRLPDVKINSAEKITDDKDGTVYCRVLGTIGRETNFELLMPDRWNSRFVMGGGGGFVGSIQNMARWTVHDGYATAGTDTGHQGNGIQADWALDNMEREVNFGFMAVHRTTEVSKVIILQYYGEEPAFSYFLGCSRGGGQALMEAKRYPADFDGIVSGAPAIFWPATGAKFIADVQKDYPDPEQLADPVITRANLALLQTSILAECDAIDGVKDGILNDPRECDFKLSSLPICKNDRPDDNCFTASQLEAIRIIYDPVKNPEGQIYPGFPMGGENESGGWIPWIVGTREFYNENKIPSLQYGFGTEMFKYLVYNDSAWDYSTYDFKNYFNDTRYASAFLDAGNKDYSPFKNHHSKLILYHGWSDPALSALSSIEYYESVEKNDPGIRDYFRLFLLPGVLHCGGGPGPDDVDWIKIMRDWVENGIAPERVIVSKTTDGKTTMTRPVFPYPRKAVYDGKGDPNLESSFK